MRTKNEETPASLEAKYGDKMIEIKIGFFTNDLAAEAGKVIPKHAWTAGFVRVERNDSHGIKPEHNPRPFHSLLDLGAVIERVLIEHGIKLHPNPRTRKYLRGK